MQHLTSLIHLTNDDIEHVFALSAELKHKLQQGLREPLFPGRVLAMLFEKPSLRTRVSFESAMTHLGGNSLFLGSDVGFGQRESMADFTKVLSQYVDLVVCRAKDHDKVEQLAHFATCPVINGLTDLYHPCQALTDLFTVRELFDGLPQDRPIAFVGDANNVSRSLALACGKLGVPLTLAAPHGYQFDESFLAEVQRSVPALCLQQTDNPRQAVRDASAVYTDVWASMGQEDQQEQRRRDFASFQVNAELLSAAPADCRFLHCLPARRGEEVTDGVMDGPQSAVLQQAANRLHVQKGLLAWLLQHD